MSLSRHIDFVLHAVNPEMRSIGSIAAQIRNRSSQLHANSVEELIGALNKVDDTSKVGAACRMVRDWQFRINPWTPQGFCSIDWGSEIGARCERVRPPKVSGPAFDGVVVVMPELKVENGVNDDEAGLEVIIALEKRAMERLRGMEEFTTWAQWRCS